MNSFPSVIIVLLVLLIQGFMQLTPSVFAIFYHSAIGKMGRAKRAKKSQNRVKNVRSVDDLSLYFILGTECFTAMIFTMIYYVMTALIAAGLDLNGGILQWILAGVLVAEAGAAGLLYFRQSVGFKNRSGRSGSTELFIPRRFARNLTLRAENVKTRGDAFFLGLFTPVSELIFTIPLYILIVMMALPMTPVAGTVVILLFILSAIVPLFVILALFRTRNLAEIQRGRVRSVLIFRTVLAVAFLILAVLMVWAGMGNY